MIKRILCLAVVLTACLAGTVRADDHRPPSVPLVACNPLFSIWSNADKLTDDVTRHWTKKPNRLTSMIRVDGHPFRLMGDEPTAVPALPQLGFATVLPTRTIYQFEGAGVHVTLTFFNPDLPTDVDVLSRPLTYLTWSVKSTDGAPHAASLFLSASGELAVDHPTQKVVGQRATVPGFTAMRMGTPDQPYVQRNGDDSRIDWGYAYVAADEKTSKGAIAPQAACFDAFAGDGSVPPADMPATPVTVSDGTPTMAVAIDLGSVTGEAVERRAMLAYDDVWAVDFFGRKQRGFWRKGATPDGEHLIAVADRQYAELLAKSEKFDAELMADCAKIGGDEYAYMCSLAYRQTIAGCGIAADANGQPMMFTKENTSNGNMATVDVLFPMDPIWVLLSPTLAKASVAPVFTYASSPQWKIPYAPHDLGEYPVAFSKSRENGTVDASEPMPVEESGNLIILADAIAHDDGNTKFVDPWWPEVTKWVDYLEKYGPDPESQLCTDDFNGRLAHNSNLGVKAIVGLGAYADLAKMRGDMATYNKYIALARADARNWMKQADDGDHYRLAYNKPGTWSQVYNLVWDQILGLNVFPPEVAQKEIAHYKQALQPYGLPLDSRNMKTKSDWTAWAASLANSKDDFQTLIAPMGHYLDTTPDRVPFSDGYYVDRFEGRDNFFHARPVIGGVFVRMLTDPAMWKKWSSMDHEQVGTYAPLPTPPVLTTLVPTGGTWRYTTANPGEGFFKPGFDDASWKVGPAGFGQGAPHTRPKTNWSTDDIWLRRTVTVPGGDYADLEFHCFHDEDVEIYVNGVLAATGADYTTSYVNLPMSPAGRAALRPGENLIAVHCHQTVGGQFIDVGIVNVTPGK
jgi:hypothetical protein